MVTSSQGEVVRVGEGRSFRFSMGNHGEVKASQATGLKFGFMRTFLPEGTGMPLLHVHRSMDEAFQILEGTIEYRLGDRYVTVQAGDAVLIPAGVAHCFRSLGSSGASLILVVSPAEGIDLIEELSTGNLLDTAWTAGLLVRHDTELLETRPHWGPPAGLSAE